MYRIFLWDESKQYAVRDLCTFETMEDKNKAEIWRSWSQQKIRDKKMFNQKNQVEIYIYLIAHSK